MHLQSIEIRRAVPSDAEALSVLAARTFSETFSADNSQEDMAQHLSSAYGIAQQSEEITDTLVATLVVDTADGLVGFAQIRKKDVPDCVQVESPVELHRFYLLASCHGLGIAKKLMDAVLSAAEELGGKHIWLGVWERNARALSFYRKSGFTKIGSHVFMVGNDAQNDYVFIRPI